MKLETYLNAMQFAQTQSINLAMLERLDPYYTDMVLLGRRERLLQALRTRILKMFSIGRSINADLYLEIEMRKARIAELEKWIDEWCK